MTVNTDKLFNELKAKHTQNNKAIIEDENIEIEVNISEIRSLFTVKAKTVLKNANNIKDINNLIGVLNNAQNETVYGYEKGDNSLVVNANVWVDKKPSYKALQNVVNLTIANLKSVRTMIESEDK